MTAPRKVRIAVATEYPLLQRGGTEALVRELVLGLAPRFEIVLVSADKNREALGDSFASLVTAHFTWDKTTASRESARSLARPLVDSGIVLAHFHGGGIYEWQSHKAWQSPLFHLGRAGIPCLITSHLNPPLLEGFTRPDRPSWQKALLLPKAWLSKAAILRRAIIEIFVSKHDCLQARRFYPPFAGKFRQLYHSTLNRNISGLPQEERKKTVFCLGTFCERKAQTILVRAFALVASRHPDWNLHLMGLAEKSAYLDLVHEAIARSGLSDRIQISPAQNNPGPFLASAAVFAMPSLLEGLPLSLQEALYYECACVGSDTGGFLELIENEETGLLVPPGDEKALAAALDRLMSDPKLRLRLGRRARQSIIEKGMLAELMVDQHVRIYEKILAGGKA